MTDYLHATGNGGQMMIRDTGSTVYLYVMAGSTQTWCNGLAVSWNLNGAGSGSINYPTGANWYLVKSGVVSTNQTITFSIGASGTSGLGGPSSFSVAITRIHVPSTPGTSVGGIATTYASIYVTQPSDNGGDGVDAFAAYCLRNNAWPGAGGQVVDSATGGSFVAHGLARATTYFYTARAHNSAGWSGWTAMKSFKTPSTVPDAPSAVTTTQVTQTTLVTAFTGASNGGSAIVRWELGYGLSPTAPTTVVQSSGTLTLTGLTPGSVYYFWGRGVNAIGTGPWSLGKGMAKMIAGSRVMINGVWHEAIPYVNVAGVWKIAQPWGRVAGIWRKTG